jgi:hypothetical protein
LAFGSGEIDWGLTDWLERTPANVEMVAPIKPAAWSLEQIKNRVRVSGFELGSEKRLLAYSIIDPRMGVSFKRSRNPERRPRNAGRFFLTFL